MENKSILEEEYSRKVKKATPTHNVWLNMLKAFIVGGIICVVGQVLWNILREYGVEEQDAYTWVSILLVLISVILTGFNVYPSLAAFGGAGALVPITGFANGVAASAIEFKADDSVIIGTRSKKPKKIEGFR